MLVKRIRYVLSILNAPNQLILEKTRAGGFWSEKNLIRIRYSNTVLFFLRNFLLLLYRL